MLAFTADYVRINKHVIFSHAGASITVIAYQGLQIIYYWACGALTILQALTSEQ